LARKRIDLDTGENVMSEMTRRTFFGATTGAPGACALNTPAAAGVATAGTPNMERAKVYTVFIATAPSPDDTNFKPDTNEAIARRLQ
jgi:hypothetical protein